MIGERCGCGTCPRAADRSHLEEVYPALVVEDQVGGDAVVVVVAAAEGHRADGAVGGCCR